MQQKDALDAARAIRASLSCRDFSETLENWCYRNALKSLARQKRFELMTPRFVVCILAFFGLRAALMWPYPSYYILLIVLPLLARQRKRA